MEPTDVESAINLRGDAAMFVTPNRSAPQRASVAGRRILVSGPFGEATYRIAREAAKAAKTKGWLLFVEIHDGRVVRETPLSVGRGERG